MLKPSTLNCTLTKLVVPMAVIMAAIPSSLGQISLCPEQIPNVSPCYCGSGYGSITCSDVPMEEVKAMFHRTSPPYDWNTLTLTPLLNESIIPADLMGDHRVSYNIQLNSPDDSSYKMRVHPDAFASSRTTAYFVSFYRGDFSQFDFQFLAGFDRLGQIDISECYNVHLAEWAAMPSLPGLEYFTIQRSTGLNEWSNFPTFSQGLLRLHLPGNVIEDEAIDRIVNWTVTESGNKLEWLDIHSNKLTRIPMHIPQFTKLRFLDLSRQAIYGSGMEVIHAESLVFRSSTFFGLVLDHCNISTIEPGAFAGNIGNAYVELSVNNLTRFESSVFESMLRDMVGTGVLYISANPFDCTEDPCHLAWLLRDNRELLQVFGSNSPPKCSDGTLFEMLSPSLFDQCP